MKKTISFCLALFLLLVSQTHSQVGFVNAFPNLSFSLALFLTHAGDGTNRIFVVQQRGLIRVFPNDSTASSSETFLNLTNKVSSTGNERGLLGLAFHPNYSSNRYFYVNYTRLSDGATIVSRFTTQMGNPNKADSLSELILLTIAQPFTNHNGGMVMFGQDGYLYIGMGDGGSAGDPGNRAQDTSLLLGKMLRIDVNNPSGGNNYGIPPGNPYPSGTRPEIYATGLRNPWRFSQDPVTGTIYCGDVGQDAWEEVDTIAVGKNYGWRCYEGNKQFNLSGCGPIGDYTFPIAVYQNVGSDISITGGYVYRGTRVPWLVGRYVYADYGSRKVWKLLLSGGVVSENTQIGTSPVGIPSFGVDQNNEMYVVGTTNIYKLLDISVGINGNSNQLPEGYSLEQNYPNPFNPSTTINFSLPVNSEVSIQIFDVSGKEIETIHNGTLPAGVHSVVWNASNFPSGVYFYRMSVGGLTAEKKMVLIK